MFTFAPIFLSVIASDPASNLASDPASNLASELASKLASDLASGFVNLHAGLAATRLGSDSLALIYYVFRIHL